MTDGFAYHFEWDVAKAKSNRHKHGLSFDEAVAVFSDPLMLSIPDIVHSETEERWVTLGMSQNNQLIVVIHTFDDSGIESATIRIISARPATKHERRQYENDQ